MQDYSSYRKCGELDEYFGSIFFKKGELGDLIPLFKNIRDHFLIGETHCSAYLNESLFDDRKKKIAYLQGILNVHGDGKSVLSFANASNQFERCRKWIKEICFREVFAISKIEIFYSYPIVNVIHLHENLYKEIAEFDFTKNIERTGSPHITSFRDMKFLI
jgi:hypothetical protein